MYIASLLGADIMLLYMDKILTSMDIKDPGLRSLPPGVERYLIKGGGLSVITLDPVSYTHLTLPTKA